MFAAKKLRNFIPASRPCKRHKIHLLIQPRLEVLENRCLPTVNIWDAVGTIGNWNNPGSWSLVHVPTASESVIFNSGPSCLIDAPAAGTNTCAGIAINGTYGRQIQDAADLIIGSDGLAQNSGVFLVAGSSTITDAGTWSEIGPGVFLAGMGTVDFNGGSGITQLLNGGGSAFNNVIHSGAGKLQLTTNALTINGTLTNNAGTLDPNDLPLAVAGLTTIIDSSLKNSGTNPAETLSLNGGLSITGGTLSSGGGSVVLGRDVAATSDAFGSSVIQGNMNLGGTNRIFAIAAGGQIRDLVVQALITNGGISKDGNGVIEVAKRMSRR